MARKPKGIIRGSRITQRLFNDRAFAEGVFNDEYILVVGSSVVLDPKQFPNSGGDINQYIINEINNDRRQERADFVDHQNFTDVFRGTPRDEVDPIYSLLTEDIDYDLTDISTELTQLLRTRLFKFVLTTTIDSYVETLMRDIWGDNLRIVNISDNQSLKDFQDALAQSRVNKYVQPTLFYVFGKVIKGRPKPRGFVETDVDAIKVMEKWMMGVDHKYIVPFLKEKRLLALGCKYEDWYFRFFWYILTRGFEDSDREGTKDIDGNLLTSDNLATVFDPNDPSDQHLKDYLLRRGVCMHEDVWQFMNYVYTLLTSTSEDSPVRQMVLEKRRSGGIFISYKSADVLAASELFCKLSRERDLNVWFDNHNLDGGDDYEDIIPQAIREARIFIPILTPSIAQDLEVQGERIDTFYSREWRWAAENKQIVVLPVAVGGYDFRAPYNHFFEHIVGHQPSGIDMSPQSQNSGNLEKKGYAKLVESIMKHLRLIEP